MSGLLNFTKTIVGWVLTVAAVKKEKSKDFLRIGVSNGFLRVNRELTTIVEAETGYSTCKSGTRRSSNRRESFNTIWLLGLRSDRAFDGAGSRSYLTCDRDRS